MTIKEFIEYLKKYDGEGGRMISVEDKEFIMYQLEHIKKDLNGLMDVSLADLKWNISRVSDDIDELYENIDDLDEVEDDNQRS